MPPLAERFPRLWIWWRRAWRFRSAGLSFSLAYGLVFALSAALFLSLLWWHTNGLLERQVDQAVEADARNLGDHWVQDGLPGLVRTIQDRLRPGCRRPVALSPCRAGRRIYLGEHAGMAEFRPA
ncbi:two component sensor histidine kinase [Acidomonas methanolica NBRC 104435]|uniref:Two component sensor histidine kinase n=1 Tax=Acidomonas methanolica NBRC 104435 TaxID=1231351 RepID=A0A023D1D5_ACIMT|nr:two component sensor histidine kinase [Acidomonas methanolica NBRC 104435]GEK98495.1 hypothetical protein AME01nite_09940 [Acidomonas methanolica NBRC 104435]